MEGLLDRQVTQQQNVSWTLGQLTFSSRFNGENQSAVERRGDRVSRGSECERDHIPLKNCQSLFGQPLTSGQKRLYERIQRSSVEHFNHLMENTSSPCKGGEEGHR